MSQPGSIGWRVMRRRRQVADWGALPADVMVTIFAQLGDEIDLRSSCCVSKAWRMVCRCDGLWRALCDAAWSRSPALRVGEAARYFLQRTLYERRTLYLSGTGGGAGDLESRRSR